MWGGYIHRVEGLGVLEGSIIRKKSEKDKYR